MRQKCRPAHRAGYRVRRRSTRSTRTSGCRRVLEDVSLGYDHELPWWGTCSPPSTSTSRCATRFWYQNINLGRADRHAAGWPISYLQESATATRRRRATPTRCATPIPSFERSPRALTNTDKGRADNLTLSLEEAVLGRAGPAASASRWRPLAPKSIRAPPARRTPTSSTAPGVNPNDDTAVDLELSIPSRADRVADLAAPVLRRLRHQRLARSTTAIRPRRTAGSSATTRTATACRNDLVYIPGSVDRRQVRRRHVTDAMKQQFYGLHRQQRLPEGPQGSGRPAQRRASPGSTRST